MAEAWLSMVEKVMEFFSTEQIEAGARRNGEEHDDEEEPRTDAIDSHHFERFNPAIGATYALPNGLILYANYSQRYRALTVIELPCADPGKLYAGEPK